MMLVLEALAAKAPQPAPTSIEDVTCAVTGWRTKSVVPLREVFTEAFSNTSYFSVPTSSVVDKRVAAIIKTPEFRLRSWIYCDGEIMAVERREVLPFLEAAKGEEWGVYAAVDCRFHGILATPLNRGWGGAALVQIGKRRASYREVMLYMPRLKEMYESVGRKALITLSPSPKELTAVGYRRWCEFAEWARWKRGLPEYELGVWLLPPRSGSEGEDGEGAATS